MTGTFANLRVVRLTPEHHARTCGYWYTVTDNCTAHTAFETRAALDEWLRLAGMTLDGPLEKGGAGAWAVGSIRYILHMSQQDLDAIEGEPFAGLQNGDYTLYKAHYIDGVRVHSCCNPNVRDRLRFDYRQCRERIAHGNYSVDGLRPAPERSW